MRKLRAVSMYIQSDLRDDITAIKNVDEHIQILKREHEKGFYIANIRKLREEKR
jgi:hypothetical protein